MSLDDRRLIMQCQAGDQAAFGQLVERYQRRVYAVVVGMVRDRDEAMDLTQEVFIKVYKNLHRFRGTASFYTWIYRIAVNRCIDHLRKQGRAPAVEYDDERQQSSVAGEDLLPATLEGDPLRSLRRQEIRALVDQALQQLSPNHRAVLLMREVEGLSYSEMAQAMRCSKGTIMSRLFHARRNMQQALTGLMDEAPAAVEGSGERAAPIGVTELADSVGSEG